MIVVLVEGLYSQDIPKSNVLLLNNFRQNYHVLNNLKLKDYDQMVFCPSESIIIKFWNSIVESLLHAYFAISVLS